MKIKFFNPQNLEKNLKATIHKSGKLGFTIESANKMNMKIGKSALIGRNEDDIEDKNLYIIIKESLSQDSFPLLKAGNYFYINTKALFDNIKIDYKKNNISFDVTEEKMGDEKVFLLNIKERERLIK